jgi:hypothetical protein
VYSPREWWNDDQTSKGAAMGQVLHSRATTTETVRRAIQSSQASLRTLAKQYGINPKTVLMLKPRSRLSSTHSGKVPSCWVSSQNVRAPASVSSFSSLPPRLRFWGAYHVNIAQLVCGLCSLFTFWQKNANAHQLERCICSCSRKPLTCCRMS